MALTILLGACAAIVAFPPGAFGSRAELPDTRVDELVSTAGNTGEPYLPASPLESEATGLQTTEHPFQAAAQGEALTYVGEPPAIGGSGETGPGEGNQWLARRASDGWRTETITPAATSTRPGSEFQAYQAFTGDLSVQYFEGGRTPLTSVIPSGCRALYARAGASGAYTPQFTTAEAPVSSAFEKCGRPMFAGMSEYGSDVAFQTEAALVSGSQEATETPPGRSHSETGAESGEPCMFGCNLYVAAAGHLTPVNVIGGEVVPNATFGGYPGEAGFTNFSNAISGDGSRVYWTDTQEGARFEHVYVLENGSTTVQVSGAEPAEYWTATPDGRYAFYSEAGALWRFDSRSNTRDRITAESAGVQGVIGINQSGEDGAYVYFVAHGVLAANKREFLNASQEPVVEEPIEGEDNLYLLHSGSTSFIARLSQEDNEISTASVGTRPGGDWKANLGERTAAVSPDGKHLVFQAVQELTGYDNHGPGKPVVEVFVYGADEPTLACASCDPSGSPPSLREHAGGERETRLPVSSTSNTYLRRWMSSDGSRVFFDSEQPLVAQDTNEVQDVYEWEREGTAGCPAATSAYRGCVFLLSGGDSRGYSSFVDADLSGDNVFFEHQGPLGQVEGVPADRNEIYDARVNGGFAHSIAPPCTGTACQTGPEAPPALPSPASLTFAGMGNFPPAALPKLSKPRPTRQQLLAKALKRCRTKPRHQRATCEARARRRYGSKPKHRRKGKARR